MTTTTITYKELAKRLDSIFLFNRAPELDLLTNESLLDDMWIDYKATQLRLYVCSIEYAWKRWIRQTQ